MGVDSIPNSNKTVDIFYDPNSLGNGRLNGGVHVREKGKQGFPLIMGDSSYKTENDVLKSAQWYLDKGYSIENIRINGQPITDKFQKNKDGKYEPVVCHAGDTFKITAITNPVSFSGTDKTVQEAQMPKKEASTGKKWGVGLASFFVPGLGQAVNGEWGKAAGFFLGTAVTFSLLGPIALIPAIWSIVDAVKNAK